MVYHSSYSCILLLLLCCCCLHIEPDVICLMPKSSNKLSARGHETARAIRRSKEHNTYLARKKKGETSPKRST